MARPVEEWDNESLRMSHKRYMTLARDKSFDPIARENFKLKADALAQEMERRKASQSDFVSRANDVACKVADEDFGEG